MKKNEDVIKHLEFIESVIERQARNTFQIKAWSIAILVGLAGLSRASREDIFLAALGSVLLFWILDGFYFSKERKFRALYDKVRKQNKTDFSMNISDFKEWKCSWFGSLFTITLLIPYGSMVVGLLLFNYLTR